MVPPVGRECVSFLELSRTPINCAVSPNHRLANMKKTHHNAAKLSDTNCSISRGEKRRRRYTIAIEPLSL